MVKPGIAIKPKTLILAVSAEIACYRYSRISDQVTLEQLSDEVLDAFEFINDHAHTFFMNDRPWTEEDCCYAKFVDEDNDFRPICDYTLRKARLYIDHKFVYVFDFGDDWKFHCRLLNILDEITETPEVIRSKGYAPEQDHFMMTFDGYHSTRFNTKSKH